MSQLWLSVTASLLSTLTDGVGGHAVVWGTLMAVKDGGALKAREHSGDGMCTAW